VDKKDLKQIGELIHKEIKANNKILMSSVDKKFDTNNKILMGSVDKKFDTNNKILMGSVDKKFDTNNKILMDSVDKKFDTNNKVLLDSVDKKFENNNQILSLLIDLKFDKFENRFEQKMLNWKSEIVNSVDVLATEIRDEREFRDISSHQTSGNTRRIEKLESKVFGTVQSVV
jgi:hypothetical protein